MIITCIKGAANIYTSNVYLVMGDWKRLKEPNTLIDVGSDPSLVDSLQSLSTGVGKKRVERVVLTHSHSDHCAILPLIRKAFNPEVFAFNPHLDGVDHILKHGDQLRIGDRNFEIIHTPGHSEDSICLLNSDEGVLFAGDAAIIARNPEGTYDDSQLQVLKEICRKDIRTIYFGHGSPLVEDVQQTLFNSLKILQSHSPDTQAAYFCSPVHSFTYGEEPV